MELKFPENIKEIINGIYYRFSEKFGLNYHSQPVSSHLCPFFCLFPPPPHPPKKKKKIAFCTYAPSNFTFFPLWGQYDKN